MSPRAPAMSVQERRSFVVDAAIPLLREKGRAVTTQEIAAAAGIAEGTIFRAFATKEELIDEAVASALDPTPYLHALERVDRSGPLRERLVAVVTQMQARFAGIFRLMSAMGMMGPPEATRGPENWRTRIGELVVEIIGEDASRLRVQPGTLERYLRMLAFVGCNEHMAAGPLLTPDEIVSLVLDGALKASRC